MNVLSQKLKPTESEQRAAIARMIRRICTLREQGAGEEARRLHDTELGNAVRDFRLAFGPDALSESDLRAMQEREAQRIADAVVLAEFLIPQLVAARIATAPAAAAAESRDAPVRAASAPLLAFAPDAPSGAARGPAAGSPAIPDLLDAMLAAERNGRRATANQRQ